MAILTNDKALVREFVRINFINATSTYPDWEAAEDRYLIPVIGYYLYAKVKGIAATTLPEEPTEAQLRDAELLRLCRTVVAPLAYLLELPLIHTQLTDAGLRTLSTDNLQAAHRWEYNEVKQQLSDKGTYGLEALLRWLFHNKEHYSEWTDSNAYTETASLIFKTGEEFSCFFPLQQPHRFFWELRPIIREVEDFYIASAVGEPFYTALKAVAQPSAEEKAAIALVKKCVAQLAMAKAVEKLSVIKTDRGFSLQLSAGNGDSTNAGDAAAANGPLSMLHDSCTRDGEAYLLQLQDLLNGKASAEVFAAYFTSDKYKAPAGATACEESPNRKRKIFGL